jgi:pimeloyl-ACP methyl ester carboxylesterase
MKYLKIIGIILFSLLLIFGLFIGIYIYRNMNYDKNTNKILTRSKFIEKQAALDDGTILNYGEGPDNGPPLLLIHGQMTSWEDYVKVLPKLSKYYHIYTIDCHGHGKSSKNNLKYTAEAMGNDFVWFIENIIRKPVVVSGHSSGGLLAAWLAANSPQNVLGLVIEDAPFFSTEPQRYEKTYAWLDGFKVIHNYQNQKEENNYIRYYLENCYLQSFFGESWDGIKKYAFSYLEKHPNERLRIFFLPPSMNRAFDLLSGPYDINFGNTFYDYSWFKNFDQAETLTRILCPSILIHASWSYSPDGVLLAAMDENDAQRAHGLIKGNELINIKSGHDVHYERPKEYINIMINFLEKIEKN